MQDGKRLLFLFNDLPAAITSFGNALEIDLTKYNDLETDIIKNG